MSRLPKNSLKLGIGSIIKIGRLEITITPNMYILDKGACIMLCINGDKYFYYKNYNAIRNITIPNKTVKAIDFNYLIPFEYKGFSGTTYPAYKFKNL